MRYIYLTRLCKPLSVQWPSGSPCRLPTHAACTFRELVPSRFNVCSSRTVSRNIDAINVDVTETDAHLHRAGRGACSLVGFPCLSDSSAVALIPAPGVLAVYNVRRGHEHLHPGTMRHGLPTPLPAYR